MPVFFSFAQVREDLAKHLAGLTVEQIWRCTGSGSSIGFHLKHMAGSVDRLSTYLSGAPLSETQLESLRHEHDADQDVPRLLEEVSRALDASQAVLCRLDPATMFEPRMVGRRRLPTTVLGLLVHLAEHTQRHLGQVITLAQILRQSP
ncbi:MAG: DinB family protein [Acidobacteriaceae bacterium]|nr:DinB family protein [Acidobacteriaceae bacterium]